MQDDINIIVDYWNNQPCNVRHSDFPIGTLEYFEAVREKRYRAEPHILDFAGFHRWRGKRVLEIGCGIGTDAVEYARHGAIYTGVDISSESIKLAKQRFDVYGLSGNFINIDAASEDLSELGKFDLVYSFGVIHHYPDIDTIIDRVRSVLLSGSEFKFMVYAKNSWKYAMIQQGLDQFEAQAGCPYAVAYTKEEIAELLKDKFTIERVRQDHCFMYQIPQYKNGIFELEPWFAAMPETMRHAVKEYLGWHLLIRAISI